jgi:hypothetical protein
MATLNSRVVTTAIAGILLLGAGGCGATKHMSAAERFGGRRGAGEAAEIKAEENHRSKEKHIITKEVNLALDGQAIALGVTKCIHDEQRSGDSGKALGEIPEVESHEVDHAVRDLITAFRNNPAAIDPSESNPRRTMHTYLAEEAESLQSCWPWLTREIRTVLTYG